MGRLSTHVLDTSLGKPGAGISLLVERIDGPDGNGGRQRVAEATTNDDGRCDVPLLEGDALVVGEYEMRFSVGPYFDRTGAASSGSPRFLDTVVIRFGIADASEHYHVPLLISPFAYSTYRGS